MKLLNLALLPAVFLPVIFLTSCKPGVKDNKGASGQRTTCKTIPADIKFSIEICGKDIGFRFWKGASATINDYSYMLGLAQKSSILSRAESQSLHQWLFSKPVKDITGRNAVTYVLYTSIDSANRILDFNALLGAAIYYVHEGKFNLSVFRNDGGSLVRMQELDSEVNRMPVMDFYKIGLILKDQNKSLTSLVISTGNHPPLLVKMVKALSANTLTGKLEDYFQR